MGFRSNLGAFVGRNTYKLLKLLGRGGTALPGKVATTIAPDVLSEFSNQFETVVITGTNGKTLTTALVARVLGLTGRQIITNPSGSNQIQGLVSTLLNTKIKKGEKPIAVLEVDEANVQRITADLKPSTFVITNIFRDQLDRYGEIYTTYELIDKGIQLGDKQATVILNGDSPLFARGEFTNPRKYFGFANDPKDNLPHLKRFLRAADNTDGILSPTDNSVLRYHFITYANLGDYYSTTDNFVRPTLNTKLDKMLSMTTSSSEFEINGTPISIPVGGLYNVYNALAALSVGQHFNVPIGQIKTALESQTQIFGRQEHFEVDGKDVTIILIKNPVGTNSVIDTLTLETHPFDLMILLNANYADGIDTSWIFDAEFERFRTTKMQSLAVGGQRYKDINVRLKMAGFEQQTIQMDETKIIDTIKTLPNKKLYILATYTSMLQLREKLAEAKLVEESF